MAPSMTPTSSAAPRGAGRTRFWTLAVGSIGIVYGDIGTSPLYALHEALGQAARALSMQAASWTATPSSTEIR